MPEIVDLTTEIAKQSTIKRNAQAKLQAEDTAEKVKHAGPVSSMIVEQTYWDSPEAKKLFLGSASDIAMLLKFFSRGSSAFNKSIEQLKDGETL